MFFLSSPQVGFLRFLRLLSTFDWKNNPLVVNLNGKLAGQHHKILDSLLCCLTSVYICLFSLHSAVACDYTEIKNHFLASRESLPVMFIATPNDKDVSVWTKEGPSVQVCKEDIRNACVMLCLDLKKIN